MGAISTQQSSPSRHSLVTAVFQYPPLTASSKLRGEESNLAFQSTESVSCDLPLSHAHPLVYPRCQGTTAWLSSTTL